MKVAVVRNRKNKGIIDRLGQPCPEVCGKRTVQRVIDALRESGHTIAFFEGDKTLLSKLGKFMPLDPDTERHTGMVFNLSYGIQGECRYTHVPSMLEMAGIPYTGAGPLGHTLSLDKTIAKLLLRDAGVPTPNFSLMSRPDQKPHWLNFPLIVKPRHESTSYGLFLVRNNRELKNAVRVVVTQYQQEALVEEYIDGREIWVSMLDNNQIEVLPLVEAAFSDRELPTLTWEDKYHKSPDEPKKICPAPVSEELAACLREISVATFRACHCKDYARVDIRVDPSGNPFVLEINSHTSLGRGGSFVLAAKKAGYSFTSLISRILDVAHERYFGIPAPRDTCVAESATQGLSGQIKLTTSLVKFEEQESAGSAFGV